MMNTKIAYIHEWLITWGGAEVVLETMLSQTPGAHVFTTVYKPEVFSHSTIRAHPIHPSFIDRLPFSHRNHRLFLPLLPIAVEQYDLRDFSLLISISHAAAHGILPRPDQYHLAYIAAPARYAWHLYQQYLDDAQLTRGAKSWLVRLVLHYLRLWDLAASKRVDQYVAISGWVKQCVWRAYRRPATVLYPPVDIERFSPHSRRNDFYLVVSRFVPYKKIPLIVEAFNQLGFPLVIAGDGPEKDRAMAIAGSNVEFLGFQSDKAVAELMGKARAFVHMAEEDFGLTLVEAQAAGCPVLAYRGGSAAEIILDGKTGLFVPKQTVESLVESVERFEQMSFNTADLIENASRFSKQRFDDEFSTLLESGMGRTKSKTA